MRAGLSAAVLAAVLAACTAPPAPDSTPGRARAGDSFFGNYLAGRHARAANDTAAAAEFFTQALSDDPENPILLRRTMLLLVADGRVDEALPVARRLLRAEAGDAAAQLVLATASLKVGDFADALRRMEGSPRTGINSLLTPVIAAWAEAGQGRTEIALKALAPLGENPALQPIQAYHTGLIDDVGGRTAAAEATYRGILEKPAGGTLRVVEAYGRLLHRAGRTEEARALYKTYLDRNPESPAVAAAMLALAGPPPATPAVADAAGGAAEALYTTAAILSRDDSGEAVETYLALALYLNPRLDVARMLQADLMEGRKKWERAIAVYRRIDRASPYGDNARIRLAWAMNSDGKTDEAIGLLRAAADDRPDRTEAVVMLGDVLRGKERFAEAAREYDRAIQRIATPAERHWSLYYTRGIAHERSKQWPKAEADFKRSLELSPDQPSVLNYLGYSWVDRGENLGAARRMIERAVDLRPNDGFIVDSLGWALYRLGQYEDAVVKLERAIELQPDDPVINDHLGDAYWRVGRINEARFQWRRSLGLKPEAEAKTTIEKKLLQGLPPPTPVPGVRAAQGG